MKRAGLRLVLGLRLSGVAARPGQGEGATAGARLARTFCINLALELERLPRVCKRQARHLLLGCGLGWVGQRQARHGGAVRRAVV